MTALERERKRERGKTMRRRRREAETQTLKQQEKAERVDQKYVETGNGCVKD
jgi:hypothetical protein